MLAVLRAGEIPGLIEGLGTILFECLHSGLLGAGGGVGVTGRDAARVVAIAVHVVFFRGGLQVAIAHLQHVARRHAPVGVSANGCRQGLLRDEAASFGHGLGVCHAVKAAGGAGNIGVAVQPLAGDFAFGFGRPDDGADDQADADFPAVEAAFEGHSDFGRDLDFMGCSSVHSCFQGW